MITAAHCAIVLASLQEMCAYVVVDGPTRHDPGGRSVLDSADFNFLVLQLLVTSVRNTDRMIQELAVQGFNTDRISFICNRLGRESAHLGVDQVESILNRRILMTIVDDWKVVSASINIGQPLKTEWDRSRVRQDILNLALRVHAPERFAAEKPRSTGLLGKLWKKSAPAESPAPVPSARPAPATPG
jgi:septum formation inhibitor-activating ATPase MinD